MQHALSDEWSSKGSSIGRKQIVHECCSGLSWPLAISRRKAAAVSSAACTGLLALPFSDEPFSVPSIPRLLPSFGSSDILRGRGRYLLGRGLGGWLGVHYQPGASCTTGKTADWRVVPQQQRQRQRQQQGCRRPLFFLLRKRCGLSFLIFHGDSSGFHFSPPDTKSGS